MQLSDYTLNFLLAMSGYIAGFGWTRVKVCDFRHKQATREGQ